MNEQPTEAGNTEFVLPIICPHCGKQLDLEMLFSLLPPKAPEENSIIPSNSLESNHESKEN